MPDRDQVAWLLDGMNLLLAYAAQVSGRLAHQVGTGVGDLSARLPAGGAR